MQALSSPPPPLDRLISCFWYWETTPGSAPSHEFERLMPTGEASLVVQLNQEPIRVYDWQDTTHFGSFGHAVLAGPRSEPFVIETSQQERVFGIQFHPGGTFPFFREPGREFSNRDVCLSDLWGRGADRLRERLLACASVQAMFAAASATLLEQLVRPLALHPAVTYAAARMTAAPPRATVAALADEVGWSQRRLLDIFTEQIGLSPKSFCRVRRFQRVLHEVQRTRCMDWPQMALACGYYDQPHFIHDFRAFSGFTPTEYSARKTPHLNHVPLL
ncbi:DUF6597 domain-containing transcriptional factor [Silvibacterium dinghuense]|uniref:AraC family transcriptional regulator n=1 Tax=Silvibacterium dinghuense TaxID=1560006 RepID=A0A4Q1SGJ0_9BACT|nr:DUF6597 domain-containing transcriptional factor [Silvibacterium dinghuense]RXS96465.1 AraC family transcriptional regulator [Silvibacterium dinghuense]GGG90983.1 AraC family transcriptional regulator [Silvibacterium dinghuense]